MLVRSWKKLAANRWGDPSAHTRGLQIFIGQTTEDYFDRVVRHEERVGVWNWHNIPTLEFENSVHFSWLQNLTRLITNCVCN